MKVTPEMIEAGYQAFLHCEDKVHSGECLPAIFLAMLGAHEWGAEAKAILRGDACAAYPGCPDAWKLKPEDLS